MIKCNYKSENQKITYIDISGHADFAEYGSDIVCSAVSMVSYTIGNALLNESDDFQLIIKDNKFIFDDNIKSNNTELLMQTLLNGLLMVQNQYNDYIKIKEV